MSAQGIAVKSAQFVLPKATKDVTPFEVHVPQAALDDLKKKLANSRWPDKEPVTDWSQGVPLTKAQALVEYWRTRYDWRLVESTLNGLPQFRTQIDGLGIHFIHVRSATRDQMGTETREPIVDFTVTRCEFRPAARAVAGGRDQPIGIA